MLAEIFSFNWKLQCEIFSFNWKLQCGRIAEFVPFDLTTVPRPKEAPHRIAERPPGGFAVARALNLRIGFQSLSILHLNLRRVERVSSLPYRKHNHF